MTKLLIAASLLVLFSNCSGSSKNDLVDIIIINGKGSIVINDEEFKNTDSLRITLSEAVTFSVFNEKMDVVEATILPHSAYKKDKNGVGKIYVTLPTSNVFREQKPNERSMILSDYTIKFNLNDCFTFENQEKFDLSVDKNHFNGKNDLLYSYKYTEVKKALSSYSVNDYINYNDLLNSFQKKEYFGSPEDLQLSLEIDHVRIFSIEKGAFTVQLFGKWKLYDHYERLLYSHPIKSYASIDNFEPQMIHGDYSFRLNSAGVTRPIEQILRASFYDFLEADKTKFYLNKKNPLYRETAKRNKTLPIIKLQNSNISKSNISLEKNLNSTVLISCENNSGFGSGSIISDDGYILTNYHVIKNMDKILVKLQNGTETTAKLIRCDKLLDVALLKINIEGSCQPIAISVLDNYHIGESIFDIGTPTDKIHYNSVFSGVISGIRTIQNGKYIQTNTLGGGGMSGGPLLNTRGQQIGVRVWGIVDGNGNTINGLCFHIPISRALSALNILL